MRLQRLTTWLLLALLAGPLAIAWCLAWLWWEVLSPRSDLPPGGEPLPRVRGVDREQEESLARSLRAFRHSNVALRRVAGAAYVVVRPPSDANSRDPR
jgi:hypothetical protein